VCWMGADKVYGLLWANFQWGNLKTGKRGGGKGGECERTAFGSGFKWLSRKGKLGSPSRYGKVKISGDGLGRGRRGKRR